MFPPFLVYGGFMSKISGIDEQKPGKYINIVKSPSIMKDVSRLILDKSMALVLKERKLGITLDIGCKERPYKKSMQYTEYRSLDINPQNKPDIVGDAHNLHMVKDGMFDTVIATEVLEHCQKPQKVLEEIHRILKKDGVAIISTPFLYPYHPDPKDYFRYTKDGLEELAKMFREVEVKPIGNRFFFMWEMITWKLPFLKVLNKIIASTLDYKDENGPMTFITICKK
jgi:SAM-dependent methyltransferase